VIHKNQAANRKSRLMRRAARAGLRGARQRQATGTKTAGTKKAASTKK